MGAKQSKRSVDISGKEAEGAGEVVAAGGEGRVEPLADADTLKPQLNGDTQHIQTPDEKSDKEKQLDNGTPENEKDATTEKEEKALNNEKEPESPVTNGEGEHKDTENGESTPATPEQDTGKKPKKEKVKKKWSLRSISFSRKDKPKQEKKQKDEEPKTNGEPEKVPEEAAEPNAEVTDKKNVEVEITSENNDEKTPETPVTEPLTNGGSAPDTPKVEAPAVEEKSTASSDEKILEVPKAEVQPEQLPVNGLSLEEVPEVETKVESSESKHEEVTAVSPETAPAPEIPVKSEVCVEQNPLIESTPPPLPANPPPSSVASFAVTTMAPHLAETTLLHNTANSEILPQPANLLSDVKSIDNPALIAQENVLQSDDILLVKGEISSDPAEPIIAQVKNNVENHNESETADVDVVSLVTDTSVDDLCSEDNGMKNFNTDDSKFEEIIKSELNVTFDAECIDAPQESTNVNVMTVGKMKESSETVDNIISNKPNGIGDIVDLATDYQGNECEKFNDILKNVNSTEQDTLTNKTKYLSLNNSDTIECNGNVDTVESERDIDNVKESHTPTSPESSVPPSLSDAMPPPALEEDAQPASAEETSDSFPLPPSDLSAASPEPAGLEDSSCDAPPQDPIPVAEKILDVVIPGVVADIPPSTESVTLQESTEVAVPN